MNPHWTAKAQNFAPLHMIHPHTELRFISPELGYGVFATRFIPKGTITWALDALDRSFSPSQISAMAPLYREILDKYCYRDRYGQYILCWDHGRYVNHSYRSNCISTAYNYELAVRDIQKGEELTDDYGYLNLNEPFAAFKERYSKRNMVYPDDLVTFHRKWDKSLKEVYPLLPSVEKPLQAVLSEEEWQQAIRIARGEEKMESILNLLYKKA